MLSSSTDGRHALPRLWVFLSIVALMVVVCQPLYGGEPQISMDEARPEVVWSDADQVVGKIAYVSGRVVNVGSSKRFCFVNFDKEKPGDFTVVIPSDSLEKFAKAPKDLFEGKLVRVRGLVTTFREKAQIKVTDPAQIEVIESLPKSNLPAPDAHKLGDEITIATYNILNLFDHEDDTYHDDTTTRTKPREEMQRVAKIIRQMNPDVLALQEVECRGYLQRFIDVFLADMGYKYVVHYEGNDLRGIDVCLVSRVPVGAVTSYRHCEFTGPSGETRRFARDLLCVTIEPEGAVPFDVYVVHLKSNFGGREFAEAVRVSEAKKVRSILDTKLKVDPGYRFVICGDFNDTWESETLQAIVGSGPFALRHFFDSIPADERVTYNQEPHRTMIDFILASSAFAERIVGGSYRILPGSVQSSGSDHNPVVAKFRLR